MRSTLQPLDRAASTAKWGVSAKTTQSERGGSPMRNDIRHRGHLLVFPDATSDVLGFPLKACMSIGRWRTAAP
jgi:hypothetical protein